MKTTRFISIALALALSASLFTGCSNSSSSSGSSTGSQGIKEEIVIAQNSDAKSLDLQASNDGGSLNVNAQIYDTLVVKNEDGTFSPHLAKSWEQVSDLVWQFKLEEGVKFHNGEELKASDVKFTFERGLTSTISYMLDFIESVDVVDEYTFNLNLKFPYAPILSNLSYTSTGILNEKAVTEAGEDYGQNPIGTGAYMFSNWKAGDSIELVAFEDYFKGAAPTKKLKYRSIPENTSRSIALETGEVDIAYDIDPVDKETIRSNDQLVLIEAPSLQVDYVGFNMQKEPFTDVRVRQAINYAIDREGIISAVLLGGGEVATTPISPKVTMSNPDIVGYPRDVEKAKELLKEAGYENGFQTTIWTNDNSVRTRIAQIVQANLKEIGIDVAIETLEWSSYLDRTSNGEHDMFILGWTATTGDPDGAMYVLFHGSSSATAGNKFFYSNDEVSELLDLGRAETDEAKRQEYYYKAQELVVEDAPLAALYYANDCAGISAKVDGFVLSPSKSHKLYGVTCAI